MGLPDTMPMLTTRNVMEGAKKEAAIPSVAKLDPSKAVRLGPNLTKTIPCRNPTTSN